MMNATLRFLFFLAFSFSLFASAANLEFVPNKGQWPDDHLGRVELGGGTVYIGKSGLYFLFTDAKAMEAFHHSHNPLKTPIPGHAYRISFVGGNPNPTTEFKEELSHYYNYFIGNDERYWTSNVHPAKRMFIRNIYPGIDLELTSEKGQFKYNFHIAPGYSASSIQLKFEGVQPYITQAGHLHIKTSVNEIMEEKPVSFADGKSVGCSFSLKDNILRFKFDGKEALSSPRIIDPLLLFSTYTGSTADNWGNSAAHDPNGNAVIAGIQYGATPMGFNGYPTIGAIQNVYQGGAMDMTVSKFINQGRNLAFSTYLGGSATDEPSSMICDSSGNILILGKSNSNNFPTTANAFDRSFNGNFDLIAIRLNPFGSQLISSTYIGGAGDDGVNGGFGSAGVNQTQYNYGDHSRGEIVVDNLNNVYIVSNTSSPDFPTTVGAYDINYSAPLDGVIMKMNPGMSNIIFSTFLGGSSPDAVYSIVLTDSNSMYVCGGTQSSNFPTTITAVNPTYKGNIDGFIAHLSNDGSQLLASTYTGTNAYDQTFYVRADANGNIYHFSQTEGQVTVTPGKFSQGNSKQFLEKYSSNLNVLYWTTAFGAGSQVGPNICPTAFEVDSCGRLFLGGWGGGVNRMMNGRTGYTSSLPLMNAYQSTSDGSDFYLMALEADANRQLFGSYFGGNRSEEHVDGGSSRFDKRGVLYQGVCAGCGGNSDFPTTAGAYSNRNNSSNCNMAVFVFDFRYAIKLKAMFDIIKPANMCVPVVVSTRNRTNFPPGMVAYQWVCSNGQTSTVSAPNFTFTTPGTYTISLIATTASVSCITRDTMTQTIVIKSKVADVSFQVNRPNGSCAPVDIQFNGTSTGGNIVYYVGKDSVANTLSPLIHFPRSGKYTISAVVTDTNSCNGVDTFSTTIDISSQSLDFFPPETCFCRTDMPVTLSSPINGKSYEWGGLASGTASQVFPTQPGIYVLKVIDTLDCELSDSIQVNFFNCGANTPSMFTPNNDGVNDKFEHLPLDDLPIKFKIQIFDRWGQTVFKTEDPAYYWEGDNKGNKMPFDDGVYYYKMDLTYCNGKQVQKNGVVKVLR